MKKLIIIGALLIAIALFNLIVGIPLARINFTDSIFLLLFGIAVVGIITPIHLKSERRKRGSVL